MESYCDALCMMLSPAVAVGCIGVGGAAVAVGCIVVGGAAVAVGCIVADL